MESVTVEILGWIKSLFTKDVVVNAGIDSQNNLRVSRHDPSETVAREISSIAGAETPEAIVVHDLTIGSTPLFVDLVDETLGTARRIVVKNDDGDAGDEIEVALIDGNDRSATWTIPPLLEIDESVRSGWVSALISGPEGRHVRIEARYV